MPRGGSRPGAGRKKGGTDAAVSASRPAAIRREAKAAGLTPLDYMLSVMNDDEADDQRRDRMAQAAAPYVHVKPGDAVKGKKEERQEAAEKAGGKFAVPSAPKLVVDNR